MLLVAGLVCARAVAQPALSESEQRYVNARLAEREGRDADAEAAYAGLTRGLPREVLADARRRRARLLVKLERCADARPLLAQIASPTRAERLALASCQSKARQHRAALDTLEAARASGREDADLLLRLAQTRLSLGQRLEAAALLERVWAHFPGDSHDRRVASQRTQAGLRARPTLGQKLDRAERLIALRNPQQAIRELDALPRPAAKAERARWLHLRGMARFSTRHDYAQAVVLLGEAAAAGGDTKVDDLFHRARALARVDRDREAIDAYDDLVRKHASHPRAKEAEYRAARLCLALDPAQAIARYRRFLSNAGDSDYVKDARFELGMAHYDRAEWTDAAAAFERYAQVDAAGMVHARGAYWAARAHHAAGDAVAAERHYREAIAADPLHWYALFAMKRLAALGLDAAPFPAQPAAAAPHDASWSPRMPDLPAFYARLGFGDDAIDALRDQESAVRQTAPRGRDDEALARLYAQLGAVHRAYALAARVPSRFRSPPTPATQWAWDAAYPRMWRDAVDAGVRDNGVPDDLLYALMRQESGYDPRVVSHADAVGLIQLLPSTAARVAQGLGMSVSREQLYDPAINIRLAARYVGNLLREFQGDAPQLAIAGYNAGEARVHRWKTSLNTNELDLFVERMPVDETRNYVRRVTGHWARYRYLAGATLDVPERAAAPSSPSLN